MMLIPTPAAAFAGVLLSATLVQAGETKPAIVFDTGGKFDKSFNEGVANGAERFKKETGIAPIEFEVTNDTQFEQAHRRFAQRGSDLIIGVGFDQGVPVEAVAKEFPAVHFTIIDAVVKQPNVQSVLFKEQEGSFLVGIAAAMVSKTGKIGFVGGMDIPLIRRFACGYVQGAKYADPNIEVIQNMTGTTPAAWNDPAGGGTGIGVYQMAKDAGKLAIGVDSNQNYLQPGTMLTSMVKRVDLAAYDSLMAEKAGTWQPGVSVLGLKEGGVDWAVDQYNENLITREMKTKVEQAKRDIIDGKIKVQDYMDANSCSS